YMKSAAAVSYGFGSQGTELRKFIGEHDDGVTDLQFRMHDFAIGTFHDSAVFRAECLFIKLNCFRGVSNREVRCERVISVGNWFHCHKASESRVFSGSLHPFAGRNCKRKNKKGFYCGEVRAPQGNALEEPRHA